MQLTVRPLTTTARRGGGAGGGMACGLARDKQPQKCKTFDIPVIMKELTQFACRLGVKYTKYIQYTDSHRNEFYGEL